MTGERQALPREAPAGLDGAISPFEEVLAVVWGGALTIQNGAYNYKNPFPLLGIFSTGAPRPGRAARPTPPQGDGSEKEGDAARARRDPPVLSLTGVVQTRSESEESSAATKLTQTGFSERAGVALVLDRVYE